LELVATQRPSLARHRPSAEHAGAAAQRSSVAGGGSLWGAALGCGAHGGDGRASTVTVELGAGALGLSSSSTTEGVSGCSPVAVVGGDGRGPLTTGLLHAAVNSAPSHGNTAFIRAFIVAAGVA